MTIDINNANSNQIFANDLSSVGHAAVRITNAQSNIITQNYPAATCAHGVELGANAADNTIALNHFQNLPGHGVYESSAANGLRNVYIDNKFNNIGELTLVRPDAATVVSSADVGHSVCSTDRTQAISKGIEHGARVYCG